MWLFDLLINFFDFRGFDFAYENKDHHEHLKACRHNTVGLYFDLDQGFYTSSEGL